MHHHHPPPAPTTLTGKPAKNPIRTHTILQIGNMVPSAAQLHRNRTVSPLFQLHQAQPNPAELIPTHARGPLCKSPTTNHMPEISQVIDLPAVNGLDYLLLVGGQVRSATYRYEG
jgi:hypothetical protein